MNLRHVLWGVAGIGLASCVPDQPSVHVEPTGTGFRAKLKENLFTFGLFKTAPCLTRIEVWQNGKPIWIAEATGDPCSSLGELSYPRPANGFRDVVAAHSFSIGASTTLIITSGTDYCYRFTLPNQPTRCEDHPSNT